MTKLYINLIFIGNKTIKLSRKDRKYYYIGMYTVHTKSKMHEKTWRL